MSSNAPASKTHRPILMASLSVLIGIIVPLLALEIILRFLPVNDGLMAQPVNNTQPVFKLLPDREMTWSKGWNFSIVNSIKTNNAGYINDQRYDRHADKPLLAIVGDSYIEAAMVPYQDTLHGRLAKRLAPSTRVYSFGTGGAALSQYVVWAQAARTNWGADKLVILIVANDFDESLATYKQSAGFHHYVREPTGKLKLRRFDYKPNPLRRIASATALTRYVFFNVQARERLLSLFKADQPNSAQTKTTTYIGNTSADTHPRRLQDSKDAVAAFLRDITAVAKWSCSDIVFLVDGIRYPSNDPAVNRSYFVLMRKHFITESRAVGCETLDLDPHFMSHHKKTRDRFEYPTDSHWNGIAHGIAERALVNSKLLSR